MVLYINSCVRRESRTNKLALDLLGKLGDYTELKLWQMDLEPLSEESLTKRMSLLDAGDLADPMFDLARQFAAADTIVIATPLWDGSFSALLKIYLENIYITGIVSKYGDDGAPIGLCKAGKLYYVSTSGGPFIEDFGFNYVKALANIYFGIPEVELIKQDMLDVW